jgi:uncharacterized repeat protein (TIGR01451 family)
MSSFTHPNINWVFLLIIGIALVSMPVVGQTISGTVYRDFNSDGAFSVTPATGTYTYAEPGVGRITVTAYNAAGTAIATTTSSTLAASLGTYTLSVGSAGAYRVEFTDLSAGDYEAFRGIAASGNATAIQFITAPATNVNFGLNYPNDYCQVSPPLVVPCYVSGDPLLANSTVDDDHVLVSVPYTAVGTTVSATAIADAGEIGSVWGAAFQRQTKKLFTAAFLKRHVGLGPAGLGGIYVTSTTGTANSSTYVDLENAPFNLNLGASLLTGRTLPANGTTSSTDPLAFSAVGTVGLGGLALSTNGKVLYAVDLYNRQLLALAIGSPASTSLTAASLTKIAIPNPGCTNGVARPFAVSVDHDKVYVGVICTGENGGNVSNLYAHIYAMDEGATTIPTTPIFSFRLNYAKGPIHTGDDALGDNWETWATQFSQMHQGGTVTGGAVRTARAQPMLTDITFADNGDMILAFTDRGGHQLGYRQRNTTDNGANPTLYNGYIGGDLLRAHYNGSSWILEKNGTVGSLTSAGANNGQGPGTPTSTTYTAPAGEFYYQELYSTIHTETVMGSGLSLPGYNQTIVSVMDPFDVYTGGFAWFNNRSGASDKRAQLYDTGSDGGVTYGKANGLGVIKALCDAAPIEIGNRVWLDSNNNGIQDPGETPLAGIPVTLKGPGLPAAGVTVSTNAIGEYYFSSAVSSTAATGFVYSLTGLTAGGAYSLSFPTSITTGNATLSSKPNSATGTNADNIDTDPNAAGVVSFTLGTAGQNNFSYDAGYVPCVPPSLTAVASSASLCPGLPVTLSAQVSPVGSYSYVWSAPTGVTLTGASTATATATGLPTGTTTFTLTVSTGSICSTTATVPVLVNPAPIASLSATQTTICAGQSTTLIASGGSTYRFSTTGIANASATTVVSPTATTTYSVTVTNTAGCSGTANVTITVNPLPTATLNSATVCTGQSATLTASGGSTYQFSTGGTASTTNTLVVSPVSTTAYSVTVTNAAGCSHTATSTVTVSSSLAATLSSATICAGQSATLTANGGDTYQFSTGGAASPTTTVAVSPTATATYSVTVTSATGCSAITTGSVTVNPLPTATLSSATICPGQSATLTAGGGATYQFSTGGPASRAPTIVVSPASTTAYSVTVTNAGGCSSTATGSVTIQSLPILLTNAVCNGIDTYDVSFTTAAGASVTASSGNVTDNQVIGITSAQSVTITASLAGCPVSVEVNQNCSSNVASLGDYVWVDVNKNGGQDAGEAPIQGVTVTLYINGVASATTLTGASGFYSFTGLTPGSSLSYSVGFTAPTGYTATLANQGNDDTKDSDADPSTGLTQSITLANGEFNPTLDAGFYVPSAGLGDYVFLDANKNGVQDTGDTPIQGVIVTLYTNGVASATTLTSATGFYSFTGLTPSSSTSYSVGFTTPTGLVSTSALVGGDDSKDSDADPSTGRTRSVTLVDGEFNPNLDAGFYAPTASLGDYVWVDVNKNGIQDTGEAPIQGVSVTLYINGVASATTLTDATGSYSFTGLTSGSSLSYVVGFTPPPGYTTTLADQGSDDAKDSDVDPSTGLTQSVTLANGEFNPTLDAGFYLLTPALSLNKLVDKSIAQIGDIISYTIVLTNTGSTLASDVVVHDSTSIGLTYMANTITVPTGTTFTRETPNSTWTVGSLGAGQSLSLTFQARADSSGVLYNTASIPGDTVRVCTSVPIQLCPGDTYQLLAPSGRAAYHWYRNGVLLNETSDTLTVSEAGSYSLEIDHTDSACTDFSCCPAIFEMDSLPVFQAVAVSASCLGNQPRADGRLVINSFKSYYRYQYSAGTNFDPAASLSGPPQLIPTGGVLTTDLVSPANAAVYTIRVYNKSGCYTDQTVILVPTICGCPTDICVPYVIQQTKRGLRIGDLK